MSDDLNGTLVRRQQELVQMVETKGQMSVEELACHFGVSQDTIRRDLRYLERQKVLLRTHGGAVSTAMLVHRETPFLTRANAHAEAKAKIGQAAVKLISDGESLAVNGGSTTAAFAAGLGSRRDLTIVTDNVALLSALPIETLREAYLLGGHYRLDLESTVGVVGFSSESIRVDTAIIGVSGLTAKDGISTTVFEEASMIAQMISCARRTIVLADESKFGVGAFAQIAPLAAIDLLVTDATPPSDLRQALTQANVEVIIALS